MLPGRSRSPDETAMGHDVQFCNTDPFDDRLRGAHRSSVTQNLCSVSALGRARSHVFVASSHGLFLPEMCPHTLLVDDGI